MSGNRERPKFEKLPPPPTSQPAGPAPEEPEPKERPQKAWEAGEYERARHEAYQMAAADGAERQAQREAKKGPTAKKKRTDLVRSHLEEMAGHLARDLGGNLITNPETGEYMTYEEATAQSLWVRAAGGDKDAQKEVLDRLLGRPTQSVDVNQHTTLDATERISDIARKRVNSFTRSVAGDGAGGLPELRGDLDLSEDGDRGSEESGGEHSVAGEPSGSGGEG